MGPTKKHQEPDASEEFSLSTPIGKLVTKGSGAIAVLTLILCGAILAFSWRTSDSMADQRAVTVLRYTELVKSMQAQVKAQTLMTCVISMPESRREEEFRQPNSFCRRMIEQ